MCRHVIKKKYIFSFRFKEVLKPENVYNLMEDGGPKRALEEHCGAGKEVSSQLRIISCGGDGTTGWILSVMDSMNLSQGNF